MENFFSITHIAVPGWVAPRSFPELNYKRLTDDELVHECGENSSPVAWEEFMRRFRRPIASVALRTCRAWSQTAPDIIEDMIQNTFVKLCADNCSLLRKFESHHTGAFLGYLKVVTASVVYDHFRREHAGKRDVDSTTELDDGLFPLRQEIGLIGSLDRKIFLKDLNHLLCLRGNSPMEQRERAIFWLHYRHGFTAREISAIPCIELTVKGVESVLRRLIEYLKTTLIA